MKRSVLTLLVLVSAASAAFADVVYVTARTSPSGGGANPDGTYSEVNITLGDTSAIAGAPGRPLTGGARYYSPSAFLTDTTAGVNVTPSLGVQGGAYQIHYNFSSTAGNTTTNVILSATCSSGGVLSFTSTDKFQRQFGNPANQWQFLGYLTNNAGSATPTIEFRYQSGDVSAAGTPASTQSRLLFDCWRFTLVEPCIFVPVVGVTGPLSSNSPTVAVTGVTNTATRITVYQDSGSGMVAIGSKTTDIVGGNNNVTVSGLVKGARVAATQTVGGQEGCVPTAGILVGGGANPRVRVALSVRETTSTGPVGAAGNSADADIHFVGSTTRITGAPGDGPVLYPSNNWQTLTFDAGWRSISNPASVSSTIGAAAAYSANDSVSIRVFPFKTFAENGVTIYASGGTASGIVTSNDFFAINWTWAAVSGADGYRLVRTNHVTTGTDATDVTGTNFFADLNNAWGTAPTTTTPTNTQIGPLPSVKWNSAGGSSSAAGTQNDLATRWGILEAIAFAIDDLEDTGPYDLYIDNLQNSSTNWQTFESVPAGTGDFAFRAPSFSGTTSGNLLAAPNQALVSNAAADTGTKSLRVRFQWGDTNASRWLRLTTSGVGNPLINLENPTSIRFLLQPVGSIPVAPPAPTLSIGLAGRDAVLSWVGGHNLQTATNVVGPYTNVMQLVSTNVLPVTLAPYTNAPGSPPQSFFRLAN